MINVTKSHLPSIGKYKKYIDKIYLNNTLTNNGPLAQELEEKLADYLKVENILLVSNGTLALQIAYKILNLTGEVITTPFSFVATTSSLVWEDLSPIFVDIQENSLNMDANNIEGAISKNTTAIVPVHVFGNACNIDRINSIANKNNLKVIYDAAHAFGVKYKNESILNHGDIATLSFHATKIFHTIEGGALIFKDKKLYQKAKMLINFGYSKGKIQSVGINAKMNEFQAAMGLCNLDEIDTIIEHNQNISNYYRQKLDNYIRIPSQNKNSTANYGYFPIIFQNHQKLSVVLKNLNSSNIFPRRYFYPSLHNLPYINTKMRDFPISNSIADRILCLPIYPDLPLKIQNLIINTILQTLN